MPKSTQTPNADIENRFTYHPPKPGQPEQCTRIRRHAKNVALRIISECPPSRELSLALTKLEESVFWANAAIARHGEAVPDGAEPDVKLSPEALAEYQAHLHTADERRQDMAEYRPDRPSPVYALKQALLKDRDYLLGWHANIACATMDALSDSAGDLCGELEYENRWEAGQEAARRFIRILFADEDQKPRPITDDEVRGGLDDDCIKQPDEPITDSVLIDLLGLVDVTVTRADLTRWTPDMAKEAEEWAGAVHLNASDNEDVVVPPKPGFLPRSNTQLRLDAGDKEPDGT